MKMRRAEKQDDAGSVPVLEPMRSESNNCWRPLKRVANTFGATYAQPSGYRVPDAASMEGPPLRTHDRVSHFGLVPSRDIGLRRTCHEQSRPPNPEMIWRPPGCFSWYSVASRMMVSTTIPGIDVSWMRRIEKVRRCVQSLFPPLPSRCATSSDGINGRSFAAVRLGRMGYPASSTCISVCWATASMSSTFSTCWAR